MTSQSAVVCQLALIGLQLLCRLLGSHRPQLFTARDTDTVSSAVASTSLGLTFQSYHKLTTPELAVVLFILPCFCMLVICVFITQVSSYSCSCNWQYKKSSLGLTWKLPNRSSTSNYYYYNRFTTLCLGRPRWVGTRRINHSGFCRSRHDEVAVASVEPHASYVHFAPEDNHASTSSVRVLVAGCPSWHPANSVKALKGPDPVLVK